MNREISMSNCETLPRLLNLMYELLIDEVPPFQTTRLMSWVEVFVFL